MYNSLKEKGLYALRDIFNENSKEYVIFHVFKDKAGFQNKINLDKMSFNENTI